MYHQQIEVSHFNRQYNQLQGNYSSVPSDVPNAALTTIHKPELTLRSLIQYSSTMYHSGNLSKITQINAQTTPVIHIHQLGTLLHPQLQMAMTHSIQQMIFVKPGITTSCNSETQDSLTDLNQQPFQVNQLIKQAKMYND